MQDIKQIKTRHREIEDVLEESVRELASIRFALDASSIVAITDQAGKIIYANDKFCEVSKYSREELLGKDHRVINSGYHPKEFIRNLWRTIASGKVWRGEIKNKAKDGTYYWVDTTIVPFLNEKGKPYQYVSIRNEITKRKEREEEIKALPKRIIQAQEEERERISREIHDDLGQSLVTLKMLIQSAMLDVDTDKTNSRRSYHSVIKYFDSTLEKTRSIASGLRPSTLEVLGLTAAIKAMVNEFKQGKNLKIRFKCVEIKDKAKKSLDLDNVIFLAEPINFYRIIQEALTNIVKHAQASVVDISIKGQGDCLSLAIKDNGIGLNGAGQNSAPASGLGLSIMEERGKFLGGELKIQGQKRKGTHLQLEIPIRRKGEEHGGV